jgi:hypothetical protein
MNIVDMVMIGVFSLAILLFVIGIVVTQKVKQPTQPETDKVWDGNFRFQRLVSGNVSMLKSDIVYYLEHRIDHIERFRDKCKRDKKRQNKKQIMDRCEGALLGYRAVLQQIKEIGEVERIEDKTKK